MIQKIQPYNINNGYKPSFGAKIAKGALIPVKRRGEYVPENLAGKFFSQLKEIFFEAFPKLDNDYYEFVEKDYEAIPKKNNVNLSLIDRILRELH